MMVLEKEIIISLIKTRLPVKTMNIDPPTDLYNFVYLVRPIG